MSFGDGQRYARPEMVDPYAHHPGARSVGRALSGALRSAYCAGRYNGRTVIQAVYPRNLRDPSVSTAVDSYEATTWTRVAEGYRYVVGADAIVAHVTYGLVSRGDVAVHHRVLVKPSGAAEVIGADVATTEAPQAWRPSRPDLLRRARCEVGIEGLIGDLEVYVQAYATLYSDDAVGVTYVPLVVSAWLEVR